MLRRTLLASAASAALCACAGATEQGGGDAQASASARDFDVALYRELAMLPGNQFVSTYSVSSAFALLYPGARGQTAAEMAQVLGFDPSQETAIAHARAMAEALQAPTESEFLLANAAWVERTMGLEPDYARTISDRLGGVIEQVDFIGDQPGALAQINAWAARNTRDRIQEILTEPDESRRLVLTNAVYFKGKWSDPFAAAATRDGEFHAPSGDVPARLMRQVTNARYFEEPSFQAAEFDYDDGAFALAVFLPRERAGLTQFERSLTGGGLSQWLDRLAEAERARLDVTLPKVEMRTSYDLVPQLRALGLNEVFTPRADLSGVTRQAALAVSAVIHKTFLAIDEEGTEAAAVTAVDIRVTSARPDPEPPPIEFRADHPFFIVLHHKPSSALLFLGRIATIES
jgi:serpin B